MKTETADLISSDVETPFLASSSQGAGQQHPRKKPLTLLPLIALIFFEVSGGPFGTEVSASTMLIHAGCAPSDLDAATAAVCKSPARPGCGQQRVVACPDTVS
jgi:hypothetical protein